MVVSHRLTVPPPLSRFEPIRMELPNWAQPRRKDLDRLLKGPSEEEIELALFGVRSMKDTIRVDADEIEWDPEREGPYEKILAEVEEDPDQYDTDEPLIVDLEKDGTLTLNDGHHRYAKGVEEGERDFEVYIQIPKGLARKILKGLKKRFGEGPKEWVPED